VGFFYFNFFKRNVETKNVCPIAYNILFPPLGGVTQNDMKRTAEEILKNTLGMKVLITKKFNGQQK
jgi:hypothetical protein